MRTSLKSFLRRWLLVIAAGSMTGAPVLAQIVYTPPTGPYMGLGAPSGSFSLVPPTTPPVVLPTPVIEWNFTEGAGNVVYNQQGPKTPWTNIIGLGNDLTDLEGAYRGGTTSVPFFAAAHDGRVYAVKISGEGGALFKQWDGGGQVLQAGTYTLSFWAKSTGADVNTSLWVTPDGGSAVPFTVTSTWQKFTKTWTQSSASSYIMPFSTMTAVPLLISDFQVIPGSSATPNVDDLNWDLVVGRQYFDDVSHTPAWTSTGLQFTGSNNTAAAINVGHTFSTMTIYVVAKPAENGWGTDANVGFQAFVSSVYADLLFQFGECLNMPLTWNTHARDVSYDAITQNDGHWHVYVGQYDGTNLMQWVDEGPLRSTPLTSGSITLNHLQMGEYLPGFGIGYKGHIGYVRIFDTVHDVDTRALELADLRAKMLLRGVTVDLPSWTVFAGDSITYPGQLPEKSYGMLALRGQSPRMGQGRRYGSGGLTISSLITLAADIDATKSTITNNILSVFIGTNDYVTPTATFLASLKSFVLARKAAGWNKVLITTVLPRCNPVSNETWRTTVNTALRADHAWADGIVDLGDTSTAMGGVGACADTMYYGDGVHPTVLGDSLLAPVFSAVLDSL